jgi:Type II secretory pathway, ATPase PulE/Tfp pilus assembly pathway, ATPase PilB
MPYYVQVTREGRKGFARFSSSLQERLKSTGMVKQLTGYQLMLHDWATDRHVRVIRQMLVAEGGYDASQVRVSTTPTPELERLDDRVSNPEGFASLSFGSDVAEHDPNLPLYFLHTDSYRNVVTGKRTLVIGPKGSGKTAILQSLVNDVDSNYSVVITPERYARALLQDVLHGEAKTGADIHAFSATWTYTILLEVFKQLLSTKRGMRAGPLAPIHNYVRDHAVDANLDLLSRFVAFWKRIEGIKIASFEVSLKTKQLESLYKLQDLLALLPALSQAVGDRHFFVLVDELDQGWDNSRLANDFLLSLLLTALRLHAYKAGIRVVAFLRTEIFDILKGHFDQLDKMRDAIEMLQWDRRSLAGLLTKRLQVSLGLRAALAPDAGIAALFPESPVRGGVDGFGYLTSRTSLRPREVIQFSRLAHQEAMRQGGHVISAGVIEIAEEQFSKWRAEHLCSEHLHILPGLEALLEKFRYGPAVYAYNQLLSILESHLLEVCARGEPPEWLSAYDGHEVIRRLFEIGFVGFRYVATVGLKDAEPQRALWEQFAFAYSRPSAKIPRDSEFLIQPGFWKHLEVTV